MAKVHFAVKINSRFAGGEHEWGKAVCGVSGWCPVGDMETWMSVATTDKSAVTCRRCLAAMKNEGGDNG